MYFCRLLQKAGVPIYVDHDLSKECGHLGSFDFRLDHAQLFGRDMPPMPTEYHFRELVLPSPVEV